MSRGDGPRPAARPGADPKAGKAAGAGEARGALRVDARRAPRASDADPGALGRARGVSPLRRAGGASRHPGDGEAPLSARARALLACGLVVLALVVGVGGYLGFRAALAQLDAAGTRAGSATSATDAYVLFAVRAGDGSLSQAYLCYADSINDRAEMASLPADARPSQDGGAQAETLAEAYGRGGLDALRSLVAGFSQVPVEAGVELSEEQMGRVLALARAEAGAPSPSSLASELSSSQGQGVGEAPLRGLLNTLRDVGTDAGFVELSAPTDAREDDGGAVEVIRSTEWLTTVRGMRDTGEVSATS